MEILLYVGKVSLYWVLLYLCYWLMLRKNTFFRWNRYYLLGSLLAAFALPFIIYPESAPELPVLYEVNAATITISTAQKQQEWLTWTTTLYMVYGIGAVLALARLISHIVLLRKYLRLGEVIELDDCSVVIVDSNHVGSFSFFKWIVINQNDYENHFDAIMRHEMAHASQRHSLDILLVEILKVVFWFNPVLLLYKRSLQEIHEYLADAQAPDREYYAKFLVAYALNAPVASLTNHFFKPSQIKNRIQMIYKNRTSKWMLGTYMVVALLISSAALFVAGCENKVTTDPDVVVEKKSAKVEEVAKSERKVFTVVEKQPEFPGGIKAMYQFLARNIRYPAAASKANVGGRVFLSFVITETGDVEDVQVLKGIGFGCDAEAIRVLSKFPKWIPGEQGGVPVNVKYNLPINFQIEDGNSPKATSSEDEAQIPYFPPAPAKNQSDEAHIQIRTPDGPISPEEQPLYVLNGEVMEDGEFLKTMPANNISRVNVLKGGSASDLYGERARVGVVMISTKD
jgi:TonB family protein